jgi:hypothetical protein
LIFDIICPFPCDESVPAVVLDQHAISVQKIRPRLTFFQHNDRGGLTTERHLCGSFEAIVQIESAMGIKEEACGAVVGALESLDLSGHRHRRALKNSRSVRD